MSRFDNQDLKDAVRAKRLVAADLVRLSFGCTDATYTNQTTCETNGEIWTEDILLTTFGNDITADVGSGDLVFQSTNDLLEIPSVEETLGMDLGTISLSLAAITNDWLTLSQSIELTNRPVELWRVLLDEDTLEIIGAPFKYFAGVVVRGGIKKSNVQDGSSVVLECSNEFYNFEVVSGFRCNVDDHQKFFPGDTGFVNTSSIAKKLLWGKES